MELRELISSQREFDDRHGWGDRPLAAGEIISLVEKDVIGLVGEIGEFANILKKLQLMERFPDKFSKEWQLRQPDLSEEIIDTFIYLVRIAGHLNVDLETAYKEKMLRNAQKYRDYETR